jgi:GH18 family chitinase
MVGQFADYEWHQQFNKGEAGTGVWAWSDLIAQGLLIADTSSEEGVYVVAEGLQQGFDWVSLTPYMWNKSTGQFITYDDPVSISYKREFSHDAGLQGMMIYEVNMDTPNGDLIQFLD